MKRRQMRRLVKDEINDVREENPGYTRAQAKEEVRQRLTEDYGFDLSFLEQLLKLIELFRALFKNFKKR